MGYKIDEIEGIGPAYAEKLRAAGIKTTADLLDQCGAKKGRAALAGATGISEKLVLTWTNHADLMRIKGVAGEFAELLEAAGVDTVKELARRNAENLAAKMAEVNEEKKLTRAVPSASQVAGWVGQAGTLDPCVSH